jgi:drug/metabolite transporter (DMT)-like permease
MIYLLLSVLANTAIYLIFKWYGIKGIRIFDAIVFNYLTAATIGFFVVKDVPTAVQSALTGPSWAIAAAALGAIFISVFYLMSITAQKVGVAVATIASKMSLVIAVLLFVAMGQEVLNFGKVVSLIFAFAAVLLVSYKNAGKVTFIRMFAWPLLILIGSTTIDFVIAYFADQPKTEDERALYSCLSFFVAGMIGISILVGRITLQRTFPKGRDILAGIFLGAVNYGSIFFLVESYHSGFMSTAQTLQVNNLAVVIVGAIAAWIFFRESMTKTNLLGMALGVAALALLLLSE